MVHYKTCGLLTASNNSVFCQSYSDNGLGPPDPSSRFWEKNWISMHPLQYKNQRECLLVYKTMPIISNNLIYFQYYEKFNFNIK